MARILCVEDEADNGFLLETRLRRRSYDVVLKKTAEEGLAEVARSQPDLIIMDVALPGIDGYEATRQLKSAPATRAIPVIVLTAHAMAGERGKALASGADVYETKPLNFAHLIASIERLLAVAPA